MIDTAPAPLLSDAERQVELAEKLAARAIEKAFAAAEDVVAAKRAWERAERAAKRQTQKAAKGKGGRHD